MVDDFDPFQDPIFVTNPQVVPTDRQKYEQNTDSPQQGQRAPQNWYPKNFTLPSSTATLAPATLLSSPLIGKAEVMIVNTGSNPALIRPIQNLNVGFMTLNAGATLTITTEGEVWAISALGTTLEVLETYFTLASGGKGGELEWPSIDAALHRQDLEVAQGTDVLNP